MPQQAAPPGYPPGRQDRFRQLIGAGLAAEPLVVSLEEPQRSRARRLGPDQEEYFGLEAVLERVSPIWLGPARLHVGLAYLWKEPEWFATAAPPTTTTATAKFVLPTKPLHEPAHLHPGHSLESPTVAFVSAIELVARLDYRPNSLSYRYFSFYFNHCHLQHTVPMMIQDSCHRSKLVPELYCCQSHSPLLCFLQFKGHLWP